MIFDPLVATFFLPGTILALSRLVLGLEFRKNKSIKGKCNLIEICIKTVHTINQHKTVHTINQHIIPFLA